MTTSSWRFGSWGPRLVVAGLASALAGAILTHYLEVAEHPYFKRLRAFVHKPPVWQEFHEVLRSASAERLASIDDTVVTHPLDAWLAVRHDTWCVLSRELQPPPLGHELHNLPPCSETIDEAHLLGVADWFLASGEPLHAAGVDALMFSHEYIDPHYPSMPPPRHSGMSQSRGGQVLLAAYFITDDKKYLDSAILAANGLKIPVADGGTAIYLDDGGIWFEKTASASLPEETPRILNGHIFAMDILYWLRQLDSQWDSLYRAAHQAVDDRIGDYLAWMWSYYDGYGTYAPGFYHNVHILQLRQLNEIFGPTPNISNAMTAMQRSASMPLGIFERLIFQSNPAIIFLSMVNALGFAILLSGVFVIARYVCRFPRPRKPLR
jgi:hypothetical protein